MAKFTLISGLEIFDSRQSDHGGNADQDRLVVPVRPRRQDNRLLLIGQELRKDAIYVGRAAFSSHA
jgi:hypothetical protein